MEGDDPGDYEEEEDDTGARDYYDVPISGGPDGMVLDDDQLFDDADESEEAEHLIRALIEAGVCQNCLSRVSCWVDSFLDFLGVRERL